MEHSHLPESNPPALNPPALNPPVAYAYTMQQLLAINNGPLAQRPPTQAVQAVINEMNVNVNGNRKRRAMRKLGG